MTGSRTAFVSVLVVLFVAFGDSTPIRPAMAADAPDVLNLDFMVREFSRNGKTACLKDGYCYSVDKKYPIRWNDQISVPTVLYRCNADGEELSGCIRLDPKESKYDCGILTCTCTVGWDCFTMNLDLKAWGPCHKNGDQVTCCIESDC